MDLNKNYTLIIIYLVLDVNFEQIIEYNRKWIQKY